ncbi:MAG TPA: hypothetical protein VMH02_06085 [Verrucomicrobiae bacterium]|nr:hypothetical protein [Verrucomicrobiae bacterium]
MNSRAAALAVALAVLPNAAFAQATPAPAASSQADQAALDRAKDCFRSLQAGTLDRSQLDDSANMNLDVDTVKDMTAQLAPLGAPATFAQQDVSTKDGLTYYTYALAFKNGSKLNFVMVVDGAGQIAGLLLQPAP